jgi:ATP adenylyltransferase
MKDFSRKIFWTGVVISAPILIYVGREFYLKLFKKHYIKYRNSLYNLSKLIKNMNNKDNKAILRLDIEKETKITSRSDNNCENTIQIKLLKNLDLKMKNSGKNNNPFLPPFDEGIFITDLNKTHRLLFNKFMITKEHVLIITRIFEPQYYEVTKDDLETSYLLLKVLNGFCFFNSDERAGASQRHKHFQVVPSKNFETYYLQEIREIILKSSKFIRKSCSFPIPKDVDNLEFPIFEGYKYSFLKFREFSPFVESLEEYAVYLKEVFDYGMKNLGNETNEFSFNLAFGENWMFIVLRKNEFILGKISMNALGCLGSILVKNHELFDLVRLKSPDLIIEEIFVKENEYPQLKIEN